MPRTPDAGARAKPSESLAVRLFAAGEVQGVGLREATVGRAAELGVLGWVRHGDDGQVLIHAEGPEEAVEGLIGFLRAAPAPARVGQLEIEATEPEGHEQFAIRGVRAGPFAVLARHSSGFDLRLEIDGEIRSWTLPKSPSMDPAVKRMAFEAGGGGGEGPCWDEGTYEQGGRVPWPEAIDRGHAVFVLHGSQLRGGFALQRIRRSPNPQWLLIKRRDEHARRDSER